MRIVVLGAGLAGVTAAWYLAADGHEVEVIDREPRVAGAASRANGGIVASSRAFPWPSPAMRATALRALYRNDQAIRLRLQLDPHFWAWGLRFLAACTQASFERLLARKVRLVKYSQERLGALVAETGVEYGRLRNGVLFLYREAAALDKGVKRLALMEGHGFVTRVLTAAEVARVEPALAAAEPRLAGAIHGETDEAGDSAAFCEALAKKAEAKGVRFRLGTTLRGLRVAGGRVEAAETDQGEIRADAFVCALGVIDPALRHAFGVPMPIYPVKGCSITLPVTNPAAAPAHAGMDESKLIAFCPMGGRLRVTGVAEFAGYAKTAAEADFRRLFDIANELFPGATDYAGATQWVCQRPMTHDSLPRYGRARYPNLWFSIGQGHMGWAMGPGSGKIVADLVAGRAPDIDLDGLLIA